MTTPLSSHGTMVAVQLTPGGAFVDVAELGDLKLPEFMRNVFDASVQNRTIDSKVLGIIRRGTFTFPTNFIPDNNTHDEVTGFYKLFSDNTLTGWRVTFPASVKVWVASGQISKLGPGAPVDGKLSNDVAIEFSGPMIIGTLAVN